jgi:hypothetical protein
MEIIDIRKRNRIVRGVVVNSVLFIVVITYIITIILPKYAEIRIMTEGVKNTIQYIASLKQDGVNKDTFLNLLTDQ